MDKIPGLICDRFPMEAEPKCWKSQLIGGLCGHGKFVPPPPDVRLSDPLVSATPDGRLTSTGDIYPDRWPMGDTVILWAFGLPFRAVYSDYYLGTSM
ncbi:hypothetical protein N7519_010646 [Penicillium mononematosum]|uniref:uncharacterized protein n=1 Tax=Penicillium mononematosum TaxID=268346 RepID=UPI002547590A|nr:uncharacterized protein N7519_010646 [Penicillium mononematosum]KAJ6180185.1 hypothetical protein N7519_010646 [Penicillium mononematosum]